MHPFTSIAQRSSIPRVQPARRHPSIDPGGCALPCWLLPCSQHWCGSLPSDGWWSRPSASGDVPASQGQLLPTGLADCGTLANPLAILGRSAQCSRTIALPRLMRPNVAPSAQHVMAQLVMAQRVLAQRANRGALSPAWVSAAQPHGSLRRARSRWRAAHRPQPAPGSRASWSAGRLPGSETPWRDFETAPIVASLPARLKSL